MEALDRTTAEKSFTPINQYVTFQLRNETFGIEVMKVKEVLYITEVTEIPNTLPYMKGVIDLRGVIVPLVDTRVKFGLEQGPYGSDTVVLILEYSDQLIGLIADSVSDVVTISEMIIFPLISSIFYSFAFWMYTASLKEGEVSLVTPLYNFNLIFLLKNLLEFQMY